MKNKFLVLLVFFSLALCGSSYSEQFEFEVSKIEIIENNIILGLNGKAVSKDKNLEIEGKKFEYNKKLEKLKVSDGNVLINSNNIKITFRKMTVDEKNLFMSAEGNVIIQDLDNDLIFKTEILNLDRKNNILSSSTETFFEDKFNNYFKASKFELMIHAWVLG